MGRLLAREIENPSLKFDGTATKIVSTNVLDLNAGATMCCWVKANMAISHRFIGAHASGGLSFGITGGGRFGFIKAGVISIGNGYEISKLPKQKWLFMAGSYSATGVQILYINGLRVVTETSDQHPLTATAHNIGGELNTNYQNGLLAEPAIFNRVLTDEEILRIYEQGTPAYPQDGSCVLDYRFDNGGENGQTITDYSGKGNNGTLTLGSGYLWKEGPVPMRVCIPQGKPLVSIEANNNTTNLSIADATLAAAFGVSAGQVGVNGISVGAWIKKKKHVTDYQGFANKGIYGASGYGAYIEGSTNLHVMNATILLPSSGSVIAPAQTTKTLKRFTHNVAVNGLTYGSIYIDGKLCKKAACTAVGNGTQNFALISSAGTGNINNSAMHFLANRPVTSSEVINMYKYSIFPPDVLYWHGPDETGTKVACYWGTGVRVPSCDASLVTGTSFSNDSPWNAG